MVNIGNSESVQLTDFIEAIEAATRKQANVTLCHQAGDVPATWADASVLNELTGYSKTSVIDGVKNFVDWYRDFYSV